MEVGRRKFLIGTSTFGLAAVAGELAAAPVPDPILRNPYQEIPERASWLRGELHSHVANTGGDSGSCGGGGESAQIYRAAAAAKLDFVAMSVEATESCGGVERFGDVGPGNGAGVTGIPAREIQNNLYGPAPYFSEPGARFLHALTIGRSGIGICVHPRFYDMIEGERSSWDGIRSALLAPAPGGRLAALNIAGIEIFNGYTLSVLRERRQENRYRDCDEICWDELLMRGRLLWGFAANDAFVGGHDYASLSPLGCVIAAAAKKSPESILAALRRGQFYSSTGVTLAQRPLALAQAANGLRISVEAEESVDWTAMLCRRVSGAWRLDPLRIANTRNAEFAIAPDWKYVRIQCRNVSDPWQRAWLQPIVDDVRFSLP